MTHMRGEFHTNTSLVDMVLFALARLTKLHLLNISNSIMTPNRAVSFATSLRTRVHPNMKTLHISMNPLGDEGCEALASCLEAGCFPNLQVLVMDDVNMNNRGCEALARGVVALPQLVTLHVRYNDFDLPSALKLAGATSMHCFNMNDLYVWRINALQKVVNERRVQYFFFAGNHGLALKDGDLAVRRRVWSFLVG